MSLIRIIRDPPDPPDPVTPGGNGGAGSGNGKGAAPPGSSGTDLTSYTSPGNGSVLPSAYGTCKLGFKLIEKFPPLVTQPPNWTAGTPWGIDQIIGANGNAYQVIVQGNSSVTAPSGTGGAPTAYINSETITSQVVRSANGNVYRSVTNGITGAVGHGPSGTGVNIPDPNTAGGVTWTYLGSLTGFTVQTDGTIVWKYLQQLPYPLYTQFFLAALCEGEIAGVNSIWWDKEQFAWDPTSGSILPKMLGLYKGPDAGGQSFPAVTGPATSATFVGRIDGATLTITSISAGQLLKGQTVSGSGVTTATIIGYGTGSGALGTYILNVAQTVAPGTAMTATGSAQTFDASGYQHTALIGPFYATGISTGSQAELPAGAADMRTVMFGLTGPDVNGADIFNDVLTHVRRGRGWSSARVDTSLTGTGASGARVYTDAMGLRFSFVNDQQRAALDVCADLLNAMNCSAFMSQGVLKAVPLGDTAITSPVFGSTNYTPPNVVRFDLGPDDFLAPITVSGRDPANSYNSFPVSYVDRSLGYATNQVEVPILSDVRKRGLFRAPTLTLPVIFPDGTMAVAISRILAQRSLKVTNTFTVKLHSRYIALEQGDIVTITDPLLGLSKYPVRILQKDRDASFSFTFTAEDYPAAVSHSKPFTPQAGDGTRENNEATTAAMKAYSQRAVSAPSVLKVGARSWSGSWFDGAYVTWGAISIASGGALSFTGFDEIGTPTLSRVGIGSNFGIKLTLADPNGLSAFHTAWTLSAFASATSHPEYFSAQLVPAVNVGVGSTYSMEFLIRLPESASFLDPNSVGTGGLEFQVLILRQNPSL